MSDGTLYIDTETNTVTVVEKADGDIIEIYTQGSPGAQGPAGSDGRGIISITRTSGTGAPGTTDTYTVAYTDSTTTTFAIYNGADSGVLSVAGRTGVILLSKTDVGLGNVDNTSDTDKPISTATATALASAASSTTSALAGKEPTITAGTTSQFWRGDKTWADFATSVRASVLTGLSTATNAVITATDSVLDALGKLQKQITDNLSTLTSHTGNTSNPHSVTAAQVGAIASVTPGTSGNLLTSNGSAWTSQPPDSAFVKTNVANTFTAKQTFTAPQKVQFVLEKTTTTATAATGTVTYDCLTQSVLYYTSNASTNFALNFRGDSSNTLDSLMATGEALTVVFMNTNGATAYYNNGVQVDGNAITPKWQGGTAPTLGNASSIDAYTYTIIKTGTAAFTVLAAQSQFK